jgi:hypothetical protein
MSTHTITIEVDTEDPKAYQLDLPQMRLGDLWIIMADIKRRIEDGEFDSGQMEHPELSSTEPDDPVDILN